MTFDEWMAENWPHVQFQFAPSDNKILRKWLKNAYEAGMQHQEESQPDREELRQREKERE